jgi:hypothetical protein
MAVEISPDTVPDLRFAAVRLRGFDLRPIALSRRRIHVSLPKSIHADQRIQGTGTKLRERRRTSKWWSEWWSGVAALRCGKAALTTGATVAEPDDASNGQPARP